jgi:hypothetical protein
MECYILCMAAVFDEVSRMLYMQFFDSYILFFDLVFLSVQLHIFHCEVGFVYTLTCMLLLLSVSLSRSGVFELCLSLWQKKKKIKCYLNVHYMDILLYLVLLYCDRLYINVI